MVHSHGGQGVSHWQVHRPQPSAGGTLLTPLGFRPPDDARTKFCFLNCLVCGTSSQRNQGRQRKERTWHTGWETQAECMGEGCCMKMNKVL